MTLTYTHTKIACYIAFVVQAAVCCLSALLFAAFTAEFSFTFTELSAIVAVTFIAQMAIDIFATKYIGKIGYRNGLIISCSAAAIGFFLLGVLPYVMPPFIGVLIAVAVYAMGGGFVDVIVSPLVEALPSKNKAAQMSLLHSFFCWGTLFIILFATGFFALFSVENWRYLCMILALFPAFCTLLFLKVPIIEPLPEEKAFTAKALFSTPVFYVLILLMLFAGACEQLMSQWASFFAECGLGVEKEVGDLLGPGLFAVTMGGVRTFFGVKQNKISLKRALTVSGVACALCYALCVFAPHPILSLVFCALTGASVGLMWPGCVSIAAKRIPLGGAKMYAMLALFGDVGCIVGPALVGVLSDEVERAGGGVFASFISGSTVTEIALKAGILAGIIFPLALSAVVVALKKIKTANPAPSSLPTQSAKEER